MRLYAVKDRLPFAKSTRNTETVFGDKADTPFLYILPTCVHTSGPGRWLKCSSSYLDLGTSIIAVVCGRALL